MGDDATRDGDSNDGADTRKRRIVTESGTPRDNAPAGTQAARSAATSSERKRGRPRKPPPPMVSPIAEAKVQHIPIEQLDLDDQTFMFRAALRTGELKNSILAHGQQMPIVVLARTRGQRKYRVLSGFRRANAIRDIGWGTVAAIVRDDLDDEAAFRASVLENTARKTYTDLDKAYVVKVLQDRGMGSEEVAGLMGLKVRQKNNIMSLLKMPQLIRDELAKDDGVFTTTHALLLRQMAGRYPELEYAKWIVVVRRDNLSISQLKRAINAEHRSSESAGFTTMFNEKATDWDKGEIRLMPLKINTTTLSSAGRAKLRSELQRLLAEL